MTVWDSLHSATSECTDQDVYKVASQFLLIGDLLKNPIYALSEGQKGLLCYARFVLQKPHLLILDEPTAGVDVEQRRDLWAYLKELNDAGTTIILTSHYLEEIQQLCNHIAVINHGTIIWNGTKADFMAGGKSVEDKYLELLKN